MPKDQLTPAEEQILRDQVITGEQPGPILHDFQVLLDFVGPKGVEVGGKYQLLPLKYLGELDERLSRPLRLDLKRPQLRSHPYLQGLYLLLRASGMSRVEGSGAKGRLVLDPDVWTQWDRLNLTERYFNLLETWLRLGRPEMVGERGSTWDSLLFKCLLAWKEIPAKGARYSAKNPEHLYVRGIGREFYLLALLDLFGLLKVEQHARRIATWVPAGVGHLPFGDAVFSLLASERLPFLLGRDVLRDDDPENDDQGNDDAEDMPRFGAWQPLFQPYFPEWRENLKLPEPLAREGTFVFRVSLGEVWRLIASPADSTLDDLVAVILRSVKFDDDHLYEFNYRDRRGAEVTAGHPYVEEGPWADEIEVGKLPLDPGQTMQLTYDFGDSWKFTVKLERIEPGGSKVKRPRVLESHGKAPEQYPSWDE